jgi:hypothetical protein
VRVCDRACVHLTAARACTVHPQADDPLWFVGTWGLQCRIAAVAVFGRDAAHLQGGCLWHRCSCVLYANRQASYACEPGSELARLHELAATPVLTNTLKPRVPACLLFCYAVAPPACCHHRAFSGAACSVTAHGTVLQSSTSRSLSGPCWTCPTRKLLLPSVQCWHTQSHTHFAGQGRRALWATWAVC